MDELIKVVMKMMDFGLSYIVVLTALLSSFWGILKFPPLRKMVTLFVNDFARKYQDDLKKHVDDRINPVIEEVEENNKRIILLEKELIKAKQMAKENSKDIRAMQGILMKGE